MAMKACRSIICAALLLAVAQAQSYEPKNGFVPDMPTAIRIAKAVLIPIYGRERMESEELFNVEFKDGVWTVSRPVRCADGTDNATKMCNGTAEVKLSKKDGRILEMTHHR